MFRFISGTGFFLFLFLFSSSIFSRQLISSLEIYNPLLKGKNSLEKIPHAYDFIKFQAEEESWLPLFDLTPISLPSGVPQDKVFSWLASSSVGNIAGLFLGDSARLEYGIILKDKGNIAKAVKIFEKLLDSGKVFIREKASLHLAWIYYQEGLIKKSLFYSRSLQNLEKAFQKDENENNARQDNTEEEQFYIKRLKDSGIPELVTEGIYLEGLILYEQKKFYEVYKKFQKLKLTIGDENFSFRLKLFYLKILIQKERWPLAGKTALELIQKYPYLLLSKSALVIRLAISLSFFNISKAERCVLTR